MSAKNNARNGLLIDYEFCTGCHACEVACKMEHSLPNGQWGIKVLQDGPRQLPDGKYEYNYLPMPTLLCNLCESRLQAGKKPSCVQHCQAGVMRCGPVEELAKEMNLKAHLVMFTPK